MALTVNNIALGYHKNDQTNVILQNVSFDVPEKSLTCILGPSGVGKSSLLRVGDLPIYFLLAFASVWSLIISTSAGVKSIDPQWLLLARSLSASKQETLCKIVVPAIAGYVLTGLRVSMGITWVILVPCEMLGVNEGLGYFILDTRDRLAYSELMAVVVIIGLIGWGLDSLIRWALVKGGK